MIFSISSTSHKAGKSKGHYTQKVVHIHKNTLHDVMYNVVEGFSTLQVTKGITAYRFSSAFSSPYYSIYTE